MQRFGRSVFCLSFFSLVFFLAASITAAETYKNPATGLVFPDAMAGMSKSKVTVFDSPELGVGVAYNAPGASMMVFIYNLGMKEIPTDVSSPVFKEHLDRAIGDIYQAEKMGAIQNVKRLPGGEVTTMPGKPGRKALVALFTFRMQGRDMNSKLYLTQYKNNWVKLRYSYDAEMGNKGEEMFQTFLAELSAILDKGHER